MLSANACDPIIKKLIIHIIIATSNDTIALSNKNNKSNEGKVV